MGGSRRRRTTASQCLAAAGARSRSRPAVAPHSPCGRFGPKRRSRRRPRRATQFPQSDAPEIAKPPHAQFISSWRIDRETAAAAKRAATMCGPLCVIDALTPARLRPTLTRSRLVKGGRLVVALRSARFLNEHATLEVRECADRREIQIIVEAGPATATSSQVLTLRAGE